MKLFLYYVLALITLPLLAFTTTAQVAIQWDKTIGGTARELFSTALPISDGGYLLGGSSNSNTSGNKSEDSKGERDYWIVKVDQDGNKLWDKTFGGSNDEQLTTVISTSDGGCLLVGSSNSNTSTDKSEDSKGASDYWIIKIDQDGNKLWDKTIGGSGDDRVSTAISTNDGDYLLAGASTSDISGDKSEDSKGGIDYWIVKINQDGSKLWDKTFGGSDDEQFSTVIFTNDGGYLLGGSSNSDASGDKSEDRVCDQFVVCSYDYWIIKIDGQGNKIWDKSLGGSGRDLLRSAISSNDGGYLLGGFSNSNASGDKSEDRKAGCNRFLDCYNDYWVIKIDRQGNKIWDRTFGGIGDDRLDIALSTNDGGYLLAGSSTSNTSEDKSEDNKQPCYYYGEEEYFCPSDYWVVKIDEDGNNIWDKTIGGGLSDFINDAFVTADGGFLLAGTSGSNLSADKSEDCKGGFTIGEECDDDYWIVKLAPVDFYLQSFSLIDAVSDEVLQPLNYGDTINLIKLPSPQLSIEVLTDAEAVGSIALELKGPVAHMQTENRPPYALFGDNPIGNINGRLLSPGNYTLLATPYEEPNKEGRSGVSLSIRFTIINSPKVSAFDLYDAVTDQKIMGLTKGSIIYTDELAHEHLAILAHTFPDSVGSVQLELTGPLTYSRIENTQPYALFRNSGSDLFGEEFSVGEYHLKATPYSTTNALGEAGQALEISFTVIGADNNNTRLSVYPVPTSGVVQINYLGNREQAQLMLLDFTGKSLVTLPLQTHTQFDLSGCRKGIYYLKIMDKQEVQMRRIVLE